ncbi:choline dehydrogenase [Lentinula edodes]|uniref:Choline dehydrogenase n=1 Tax=Lentinula edodes TaxID=5353 RepID=A0A1Q3EI20_LENED|nr:choline dehydrogenase [Lentinula edodes]
MLHHLLLIGISFLLLADVIGTGAGGGPLASRLAEAGYSVRRVVLVIDAGHDVLNLNTTIPLYFIRAIEDFQTELNYTLDEYPPGFQFQKNDAWYPRACCGRLYDPQCNDQYHRGN